MESVIDETVFEKIQSLMDSGGGDLGRLRFIMMTLRKGKPLYHSDQKFLERKLNLSIYIEEEKITEDQSNETKQIHKLIKLGIGDTGRLQSILETIQKNNSLYNSDKKYLEEKLSIVNLKKSESKTIVQVKRDDNELKSLKTELDKANKRISNLETTIQEKKIQLKTSESIDSEKTTKIVRGTMPIGWSKPKKELLEIKLTEQNQELENISKKIQKEQTKIRRTEKT